MLFGFRTRTGPENHVLDRIPDPPWEGAILREKGRPIEKYGTLYGHLRKNSWIDPDALWVMDSGGPRKHVLDWHWAQIHQAKDGSIVFARWRQHVRACPCPSPSKLPLPTGIATPCNTWFLGSSKLSIRDGILISSAVFAQLTAESPILYNGRPFPP